MHIVFRTLLHILEHVVVLVVFLDPRATCISAQVIIRLLLSNFLGELRGYSFFILDEVIKVFAVDLAYQLICDTACQLLIGGV